MRTQQHCGCRESRNLTTVPASGSVGFAVNSSGLRRQAHACLAVQRNGFLTQQDHRQCMRPSAAVKHTRLFTCRAKAWQTSMSATLKQATHHTPGSFFRALTSGS